MNFIKALAKELQEKRQDEDTCLARVHWMINRSEAVGKIVEIVLQDIRARKIATYLFNCDFYKHDGSLEKIDLNTSWGRLDIDELDCMLTWLEEHDTTQMFLEQLLEGVGDE